MHTPEFNSRWINSTKNSCETFAFITVLESLQNESKRFMSTVSRALVLPPSINSFCTEKAASLLNELRLYTLHSKVLSYEGFSNCLVQWNLTGHLSSAACNSPPHLLEGTLSQPQAR